MAQKAPKWGEFQGGKLWFQRKGSIITLGLTDSAIEDLGNIEDVEFPDEGEDFEKGQVVLTVEGTQNSLEVTTPASGIIESVNTSAKEDTNLIFEDPSEEGWLVKLEIQDRTDLAEFAGDQEDED